MNPPIPGHHLLHEGLVLPSTYDHLGQATTWTGGCQCGARPDEWPNISGRKMKAWHRQHKIEVRSWLERPQPATTET